MTNVTERALEVLRTGGIERVEDVRLYLVPSQSEEGVRYRVQLSESAGPRCDCEAFRFSEPGVPCKHMLAVLLREQTEAADAGLDPRRNDPEAPEPHRNARADWIDREGEEYEIRDDDGEVD